MYYENTPTLETERLILRKFTHADIDDMLSLYSDKEVNRFLPWFPLETRDAVSKYLYDTILPFYEKEIAYSYAISFKETEQVIGYVHINDIGGSNDMGYALRKEYWHKGITTEACTAVIDRLRKVHFPFITATHDIHNAYSGKVMEKLGMIYRYSYEEKWQPKDIWVTFRMYQLNLDGIERTYTEYQKKYPYFVEPLV